ncbi:EmrB/QacA subfamily drug resistance transporter [Paenibacillus endophyticus]|uniref:EmrB/QacA subfamily drug resistance transporter n=1 Tax=Paenibacillus endophyticus TaxID=1294268 RepID=A0A7W5GCY7_9BACL|nr:MFS transporter [Paenibacillus endophyticus]MBB3155889.1 EmrB/QacA subfamily drug resistance transporter [Paenibacillus endophyticus]
MSDRITKANMLLLIIVCFAQFIEVMNGSTVTVALPSIQTALHMQANDLQWIVTSYVLTFACFLMIGGRASDLLGRKRVLMIGLAIFAASSLAGALATDQIWLIASRAIQGIGAALSIPAAMSLISNNFPVGPQRNKAFGIFGALGSAGAAGGSIVGGLLTDSVGWRSLFYLNVPLGILLIIGLIFVKVNPTVKSEKKSIDWFGLISVLAGIFVLVYGISMPDVDGSWSAAKITLLIIGVILVGAFILVEKYAKNPLMPLRLFKFRSLVTSNIIGFLMYSYLTGFMYFSTLYFHELGYSSLATGMAFLPLGFASIVVTQITPFFMRKFGAKRLLIVTQLINAIGMFWLSNMGMDKSYVSFILPAFIVLGLSVGASFTAVIAGSMQDVKPEEHGIAGGIVNTFLQLGGSLGLSILATIATTVTASAVNESANQAMLSGFHTALIVSGYFAIAALFLAFMNGGKREIAGAVPQEMHV